MRYDDDVHFFVQTWAEAVIRQLNRVRELRERFERDWRAIERADGEVDYEPIYRENFRERWAAEHTLIWAAHQLEQWSHRLARERGRKPPQLDPALADLRNALEHLNEADLDDGTAIPGSLGRNTSLRRLPGGGLSIGLGGGSIGDLIATEDIERRALAMLKEVEDELEAEIQAQIDAAIEWEAEVMRGK